MKEDNPKEPLPETYRSLLRHLLPGSQRDRRTAVLHTHKHRRDLHSGTGHLRDNPHPLESSCTTMLYHAQGKGSLLEDNKRGELNQTRCEGGGKVRDTERCRWLGQVTRADVILKE